MLVAAYLVGGFLVASVYAVGMLRGRRDRYHRLGFIIPFTVAAIATPVQMARRRHARPVGLQQRAGQVRRDRARAGDEQRRARDAARAPQLRRHGERRDPRSRAWRRSCRTRARARAPSSRASTPFPADERPTHARGQHRAPRVGRDGRARHAAVPALRLVRALLAVPARHARRASGSSASPSVAGVAGGHRHGGGVGRHRGRAPTLDRLRPHEGRGGRHGERGRVDHVPRRGRHLHRRSASPRSSCCAG